VAERWNSIISWLLMAQAYSMCREPSKDGCAHGATASLQSCTRRHRSKSGPLHDGFSTMTSRVVGMVIEPRTVSVHHRVRKSNTIAVQGTLVKDTRRVGISIVDT
jgi:hypothetical protein